jgi:hypothetical protein
VSRAILAKVYVSGTALCKGGERMQVAEGVELSATVRREDYFYVATCPDFDVVSQGNSVEAALNTLKEELERFLGEGKVTIAKVDVTPSIRHLEWLRHFKSR